MTTLIKATDLSTYTICDRKVYLSYHGDPGQQLDESTYQQWLMKAGSDHEQVIAQNFGVTDPVPYLPGDLQAGFEATLKLMQQGIDTIYQGVLIDHDIVGIPDLMLKESGSSNLGSYYYRPLDVKWSSRPTKGNELQVMAYIALLQAIQGVRPEGGLLLRVPVEERNTNPHGTHVHPVILDNIYFNSTLDQVRQLTTNQHQPEPFISSVCNDCIWRGVCLPIAHQRQDVSLISGIQRHVWEGLRERNLDTLAAAAAARHEQLTNIHGIGDRTALKIIMQAKALHEGRSIQVGTPDLPPGPAIFFDVESVPMENIVYLMGLLLNDGQQWQFAYDLADTPAGESSMWQAFLKRIAATPGTIYHYGYYEKTVLERLAARYQSKVAAQRILDRMVDLRPVLRRTAYLPITGYSLKDVATWLGYTWTGDTTAADDSILDYYRWQETSDQTHLNNILIYNEHDVRATLELFKWLNTLPKV